MSVLPRKAPTPNKEAYNVSKETYNVPKETCYSLHVCTYTE